MIRAFFIGSQGVLVVVVIVANYQMTFFRELGLIAAVIVLRLQSVLFV